MVGSGRRSFPPAPIGVVYRPQMLTRSLLPALLVASLALPASPAEAGGQPRQYALAVYHFNVQYVAGGLQEFWEDLGSPPNWEGLDVSDEGVQDAIIVESFLPLLQLYAEHPDWGADFELQGLMVDAIRERHPETLALMQELSAAGLVHFDSFHYSDELWTAQPAEAIARSFQDTLRAFEEADVVHGTSYFTQEGQFGVGMADVIPEGGVGMIPRNLFGLHYPTEDRRPLFDAGNGRWVTVAGHSWAVEVDGTTFQTAWTFMDDGELLATGGLNPYFLPSFHADPEEVADYEAQVQALVDSGYTPVSVAQVAAELLAAGYVPEPLPPLIDGAWQPDDTANVGLWMGDVGTFPAIEADGAVRAGYAQAYREVRMASLLTSEGSPDLDEAWRELALGGVSDSTGWNPNRGEVEYAFTHQAAARALVAPLLDVAKDAAIALQCPEQASFSGVDGAVSCVASSPARRADAEPALPGIVAAAADADVVSVSERWFTDPELPGAVGWSVVFEGLDATDVPLRRVEIPRTTDILRFVPAGRAEGIESVPLSLFAAEAEPVGLPLAGGALELGEGRWLVVDPTTTMLAARVHPDSPEVRFHDASPGRANAEEWVFWFVEGDEAALDLADRLVQRPSLDFDPPRPIPETPPETADCTCGVRGGGSLGGWLLLGLGFVGLRRRGPQSARLNPAASPAPSASPSPSPIRRRARASAPRSRSRRRRSRCRRRGSRPSTAPACRGCGRRPPRARPRSSPPSRAGSGGRRRRGRPSCLRRARTR